MEGLKDIILQYVTKEYLEDDSEPIDFETPLISGGIVDSFSMVSLKRFLENTYNIQIPDDKATPNAGLFKQERFIHSPQAADIEVEFPAGAPLKKVINMCSNNYLGLSSHPDVVKAAHEGLESRGYGMSSVRFICGTQDIHRELERRMTEFLGTEDTLLFPSCMDAHP